ncbi:MAG TPA: adenosine deaminase family protein, partial [Kiritimatiellia bacterium]|nr:adenosine deaminase family protein [Kiritimatiellia bacterium]
MIPHELVRALPKSDVHAHLDGSLRIATLIELAREQRVPLPSYEEEGLLELVFKPVYRDLADYLRGFEYLCAVLRRRDALERAAYEMAEDAIAQGVRYLEVRFAPQRLVETGEACVQAFKAVNDGLARAAREHNASARVHAQEDIPFEWAILCCAMRNFERGMGAYYDRLLDVLPGMARNELVSIASLEAVR